MPPHEIQVFGPAYLDRVLRVDQSLTGEGRPPLDQSVEGVLTFGEGLRFRDPSGATLTVEPPAGLAGTERESSFLRDEPRWRLPARCLAA